MALLSLWCWCAATMRPRAAASSIDVTPTTGIRQAIAKLTEGGTINLAAGTYQGSENCGIAISVRDTSMVGAGSASTIIICDQALASGAPFAIRANGTKLQGFTLKGGASSSTATTGGLINVAASTFTLWDCVLSSGFLSGTGFLQGGGVSVFAQFSPVNLTFYKSSFHDNTIACGGAYCSGGGVQIQLLANSDGTAPSIVNVLDCDFRGNQIFSTGAGPASTQQGGALNFQNQGSAPLMFTIQNSTFSFNNVTSSATETSLAIGGAVNFENARLGNDQTLAPYTKSAQFVVSSSTFNNNGATSLACNTLASAANSGAVGMLGLATVTVKDSLFGQNYANCSATIPKPDGAGGIAEGGALFIQGFAFNMTSSGSPLPIQPPQPTVVFENSTFSGNTVHCSGVGCQSIGGAVQVTVASEVSINAATASLNTAVCMGSKCSSQGGWFSYQNGPAVPGGAGNIGDAASKVEITSSNITQNAAVQVPTPAAYNGTCAICKIPSYGGAVAVMSSYKVTTLTAFTVTGTLFRQNLVQVPFDSSADLPFGGAFGTLGIYNSGAGRITASFVGSEFQCNGASMQAAPAGFESRAVAAGSVTVAAVSGPAAASGSLRFAGGVGGGAVTGAGSDGVCAFVSNPIPTSVYGLVSISSSCSTQNAETMAASASSTGTPLPKNALVPSVHFPTCTATLPNDGSDGSRSHLSDGDVVAIVVCSLVAVACSVAIIIRLTTAQHASSLSKTELGSPLIDDNNMAPAGSIEMQ